MQETIIPHPTHTEEILLTPADITEAFGEALSPRVTQSIVDAHLTYVPLTPAERDECIRVFVQKLMDPEIDRSGSHRLDKWEWGWGQNFEALKAGGDPQTAIRPKYFDKYDIHRWKGEFVKTFAPDFEYRMLGVILDWVFEKYLSDVPAIYEFGCGTGHNLTRVQKWNPSAELWGFDWATVSKDIIALLAEKGILPKGHGGTFSFFEPDPSLHLVPGAGVYTIAALEQVGEDTAPFIDFLIAQKPKIVVNVEPMAEFFDATRLPDFLAIEYYKKRNYLWGYLQLKFQSSKSVLWL
jgi:hypothetical protein